MKTQLDLSDEIYRAVHPTWGSSPKRATFGYFQVGFLRVISGGLVTEDDHDFPWEHVSVSLANRCPTWDEMCRIKNMFWRPDETVIQFHPRQQEYINRHEFVLHLWRNVATDHQLPPGVLV